MYSRNTAFGLFDRPVPVADVGNGKAIADLILSGERTYPLIICNGDDALLTREAKSLAYDLAGKCQVIHFKDNPNLAEEFRHFLPKDLRVTHGKLRVFFRVFPFNYMPVRHRYFDPSDSDYQNQRMGIVNGLLRNHTLEEDGCIQNISEIGRLITLSKLHRFRRENPGKEREVDELYELVTEIENERDDFKRQADYFASEHSAIESELLAERGKAMHLETVHETSEHSQAKLEFINSFSSLPSTLVDVVQSFSSLMVERLVFAEPALKEARDYHNFREINIAWEMLFHLGKTLYMLKYGSQKNIDLEKAFKDQSGYSLAMSEGRQTKKNSDLMALRRIIHMGETYDISPHIKWGNKPPKMLRIHFAFDEGSQKIIVGYIGPHMENATTRTRK